MWMCLWSTHQRKFNEYASTWLRNLKHFHKRKCDISDFQFQLEIFTCWEMKSFSLFLSSEVMCVVFTVAWQREMLILKPFLRIGEQD